MLSSVPCVLDVCLGSNLASFLVLVVTPRFHEMMEASPVAALMPPTGAGRRWSFAAGTCSARSNSGTRTSRNLSPTWNSDEGTLLPELVGPELGHVEVRNLCGKVSEFLYLSGERLFTVPSSATTFVIHGMLRDHLHLPMSCLALFPVAEGLGAGVEPCSYHVIETPYALPTLEPKEIMEANQCYRRCHLCQDFRADIVDGSDDLAKACDLCSWTELLCASCLMQTTVEGSGLFVHCVLCLVYPDDHDGVEGQRLRTQLSALSPSQKAWLENFPQWLPKEYREDSEYS